MAVKKGKEFDLFPKMFFVQGTEDADDRWEAFGCQVERVVAYFGGVKRFLLLVKEVGLDLDTSTVYRWRMSRDGHGGNDGLIPTKYFETIKKAARLNGILLPSDIFDTKEKLFKLKTGTGVVEYIKDRPSKGRVQDKKKRRKKRIKK